MQGCAAPRIIPLNSRPHAQGPVVYWMSREQRVQDNWALLHAREIAAQHACSLIVVFCLAPSFLEATWRAYGFMLRGLEQAAHDLAVKHIPFVLLQGDPRHELPHFVKASGAGLVIADFDPLRIKVQWREAVAKAVSVSVIEVDAHNIVPCRLVSQKQEYGARTLRPKLHKLLPAWLTEFPELEALSVKPKTQSFSSWPDLLRNFPADRTVDEADWLLPGRSAARRALKRFIRDGLPLYPQRRNNPCEKGQSGLSPYVHFGQISAQRVALEVKNSEATLEAQEAFLEELIVRRELADNFCLYNPDYDRYEGLPPWGRATLEKHLGDKREYIYSLSELDAAATHDRLWNAAQLEMVRTGKMHGYMRMYWGKKILSWTRDPSEAFECAMLLNDRYELDGRDPSGYAGIAWCIGGLHDRPWPERPVFGTVRSMTARGCASKFDTQAYISKYRH